MALRARKSALQVKLESTEGVDPGSYTAADVLPVMSLSEAMNPDTTQLNEFGGSLDAGETITGALKPILTARGALRGSGTPGTPLAPFSALMQASGFIETLRSATIPAAAAQIVATATANTLTFPTTGTGVEWPSSTALGTTGATSIIGEAVELAGNPTTPTVATIVDYAVSGGNITVTLSRNATDCGASGAVFTAATTIRKQIQTKWVIGSPSPHPSVTARQFRDGVMQLYLGCRPNAKFTFNTGGFLEFEFAIGGQFSARSDTATPAANPQQAPPIGINGWCTFQSATGPIASIELAVKQVTIDLGNQGQYPDDVNQLVGVQPYLIGSRKIKGTADPLLTLVATRNLLALMQAGTKGTFSIGWGPSTNYSGNIGNRIAFTCPQAKFLDASINEDNVVLRETVPWEPTGFDGGVIVAHY